MTCSKSIKSIKFLALFTTALGGAMVTLPVAQAASCFVPPAKLSDEAISIFENQPTALLESSPVGGYTLTSQSRSLAGSETSTIKPLVELANEASEAQIVSLGSGLAQAANACLQSSPEIAALIQEAIAASGNEALIAVFAAATGDTQTAALGGVGGSGGAGAGGIGGGGSNAGVGGEGGPDSTVANNGFSLAAAVTGRTAIVTTIESPF